MVLNGALEMETCSSPRVAFQMAGRSKEFVFMVFVLGVRFSGSD